MDAAVAGYAATVFAYGQTGSGKTHTMLGPDRGGGGSWGERGAAAPAPPPLRPDPDAGLVARAIDALFIRVAAAAAADGLTYAVRAAAAELYNEQLFDLLPPPRALPSL